MRILSNGLNDVEFELLNTDVKHLFLVIHAYRFVDLNHGKEVLGVLGVFIDELLQLDYVLSLAPKYNFLGPRIDVAILLYLTLGKLLI